MIGGKLLQGFQDVGHVDETFVAFEALLVDNGIGTALVEGVLCKVVAVERGTFEGEKDGSLRTIARIGCDGGMSAKKAI